jgi:hypothetical protein
VAKTPLSAGSIRRPGRSPARPVTSAPRFLMAKFSRLEQPVTPSKQRERTLSNREKTEGLHVAPPHRYSRTSSADRLTSPPVPANSNQPCCRLGLVLTNTKQRTTHFSNRRKTAASLIASSTFDGFVYGNNRNIIYGTLQAQPVSNVLGTRPN